MLAIFDFLVLVHTQHNIGVVELNSMHGTRFNFLTLLWCDPDQSCLEQFLHAVFVASTKAPANPFHDKHDCILRQSYATWLMLSSSVCPAWFSCAMLPHQAIRGVLLFLGAPNKKLDFGAVAGASEAIKADPSESEMSPV